MDLNRNSNEKMENRVGKFFKITSIRCLKVRRLKIIDKITPLSQSNLECSSKFLPIIKYLVFGHRYLEYMFLEPDPLKDTELEEIDLLRGKIRIYKTLEDFHMESFGSTNIPNRIIDLVLIGRPDLVDVERIICSCAGKKLQRKLKYRLSKITQFFESRSDLPIICIAYRGELSLKGRFPGDDIDILVSCESESDYSAVKYEILHLARKLKFKEVDWIEMYLDQPNQKKNVIFYNEEGIFRLDCYVTVGELELLRIQNESRHEALWVLGVLSHSKPIINHEYFKNYLDRFEVEVRKFHKIPE